MACRRAKRKRLWLSECDENGVHPSMAGRLERARVRHRVEIRDGKLVCLRLPADETPGMETGSGTDVVIEKSDFVPVDADENVNAVMDVAGNNAVNSHGTNVEAERKLSMNLPEPRPGFGCTESSIPTTISLVPSLCIQQPKVCRSHSWRFRLTGLDPCIDFCNANTSGTGTGTTDTGITGTLTDSNTNSNDVDRANDENTDARLGNQGNVSSGNEAKTVPGPQLVVDVSFAGNRLEIREVFRLPAIEHVAAGTSVGDSCRPRTCPYSCRLVEFIVTQAISRLPTPPPPPPSVDATDLAGNDGDRSVDGHKVAGTHSCGPGELYGGSYTVYPPPAASGAHRHSLATIQFNRAASSDSFQYLRSLPASDMLAFCRIQNQVAKTAILAAVDVGRSIGTTEGSNSSCSRSSNISSSGSCRIDQQRASAALRAAVERLRAAGEEMMRHRKAAAEAEPAERLQIKAEKKVRAEVDVQAVASADAVKYFDTFIPTTAQSTAAASTDPDSIVAATATAVPLEHSSDCDDDDGGGGGDVGDDNRDKSKGKFKGKGGKGGGHRRPRSREWVPPAPCYFVPPALPDNSPMISPVSAAGTGTEIVAMPAAATVTVTFLSFTFASASKKACVY